MFAHNAMNSNAKAALTIAAIGLAAVFSLTSTTRAQAFPEPAQEQNQEDRQDAPQEDAEVIVGTYDTEVAFQEHPAYEELMKALTDAQTGMQEAQEEGNQEKSQQVQQRYDQIRTQIIEEFRRDVEEAVPEAAEQAGVKVVAIEVVYKDDDVRTKDITKNIVESFGDQEEPEEGGMPQLPQQMPEQ